MLEIIILDYFCQDQCNSNFTDPVSTLFCFGCPVDISGQLPIASTGISREFKNLINK